MASSPQNSAFAPALARVSPSGGDERALARSPVSDCGGSSDFFGGVQLQLGVMQLPEERSLPPTPRSPSPRCSPPSSPKRQRTVEELAADSAAEDDLETRAAALGLNEVTQRVWRENPLPPTPLSPSPTFSPPSTPKQRRRAELTAQQAAAKLAASLGGAWGDVERPERRSGSERAACTDLSSSDSEQPGSSFDGAGPSSEVAKEALAAWEASQEARADGSCRGKSSGERRRQGKRRGTPTGSFG